MVVTDSLKALELYEKVFDIERVEVTDFPKGENEVIFAFMTCALKGMDNILNSAVKVVKKQP